MAKIGLDTISSGYLTTAQLNNNFELIEDALNLAVLYRTNPEGETNQMNNLLDMNSNRIINLPTPVDPLDAIRLKDLTDLLDSSGSSGPVPAYLVPYDGVPSGRPVSNVQAALDLAFSENDQQNIDIANNTSDIATNTANITTNTTDIANNTADIAANTAAITEINAYEVVNGSNANGYYRLHPDGFLEQWGENETTDSAVTPRVLTFPVPFESADSVVVQLTNRGTLVYSHGNELYAHSKTANDCIIERGGIDNNRYVSPVFWSAKGYGSVQGTNPDDMVIIVRTTVPNEEIDLAFHGIAPAAGAWDAYIDWGDGSTPLHLTNADSNQIHTYATSGDYTISVSGDANCFCFANAPTTAPKVVEVKQWGRTGWTECQSAFQGCANALFTAPALCDTSNVSNTMNAMFHGCVSGDPDVSQFETQLVTNFGSMFYNCSSANPDVSGFQTGASVDFGSMFYNASVADPDISGFDILGLTSEWGCYNMMSGSAFSDVNYDKALTTWSIDYPSGIRAHFGNAKYTKLVHRQVLISAGWTITDGGPA